MLLCFQENSKRKNSFKTVRKIRKGYGITKAVDCCLSVTFLVLDLLHSTDTE